MRGTDPADRAGEQGEEEAPLLGPQTAAAGPYQLHQPRGQRPVAGMNGPTAQAPGDPTSAALYLAKLQGSGDAAATQPGSRAWQGAAPPPPRHSGVPAGQGPWGPLGHAAYNPYAGQALPAEVSLPRSTGTAQPDAWAVPPSSALPRPQPGGGGGEPRPYQHRYPQQPYQPAPQQQPAPSAGRGIGAGSPLPSGGWFPRSPPASLDEPLSARRLELQASLGGASLSLPLGYGGEASGPGAAGEPAQVQAQAALVQLLATLQQGLAAAQQAQQARGAPPAWRWDGRGGGAADDKPAAAQQATQEMVRLQRSKPKPSPFQNCSVPWYEEPKEGGGEEGMGLQAAPLEGEQPQAGGQGGAMVEVPTLPLSERLTRSTSGDGLSLQLAGEGGEAGAATPEAGAAAQPGEQRTGGSEEYESVPERKDAVPSAPSRVLSPDEPPLAQQQLRQPADAAAAAQDRGGGPATAGAEGPAREPVARRLLQPAAEAQPSPSGGKAAPKESPAQQPTAQEPPGLPAGAEGPGAAQPAPAGGDLPQPSRRALTRRVSNPHVEMLSVLLDIEEQLVAAGGPAAAGGAEAEPGEAEGSRAGAGGKRLEEHVARLMQLQSEGDPAVQKLSLEILGTLLEAQKQQLQPSQKSLQLPHGQEHADQPPGEVEQAGAQGQQPEALGRWQAEPEQWQQPEPGQEQWQPGQEQQQWQEQEQWQQQQQLGQEQWEEERGWQNVQSQQWVAQQEPPAAEEPAVKSDDEIAAEALVAIMASEVEPSPQPKSAGRGPRAALPRSQQALRSPPEGSAPPPPLGSARVPRRRRSDVWGEGGGEDAAPPAKRLAAGGDADAVQGLYNHLLSTYVPRGRRSSPGSSGGNSPAMAPGHAQPPGHEAYAAAGAAATMLPARPQLQPAQERSWPLAAGPAGGPGAGEQQAQQPTRWLSPAEALQQRLLALQREQAQHQLGQAAPPAWQQAQQVQQAQQALAEQQQQQQRGSGGWWGRGVAPPPPYSAFGGYPPHPMQALQQGGGAQYPQQELGRAQLGQQHVPAAGVGGGRAAAPAPAPYAQHVLQQAQQQAAPGAEPWRPTAQRPYTLLGGMGVDSTGAPVPVRAMPAGGLQPPPASHWSLQYQQQQQQQQQQPAEAGQMAAPDGGGVPGRWAAAVAAGLVGAAQQGRPPHVGAPLHHEQQAQQQLQLLQQLPPELASHPLLQRYFAQK